VSVFWSIENNALKMTQEISLNLKFDRKANIRGVTVPHMGSIASCGETLHFH
jgi:hypothetical protein